MDKKLLSIVAAMFSILLLVGCSEDEPTWSSGQHNAPTNISSLFDPMFASELERRGYVESADSISPEEVACISRLDVSGRYDSIGKLSSLRGIEYFFNLDTLNCSYNQLDTLDLSDNSGLISLVCYNNRLTVLNVTSCTALTRLYCDDNQLTELNLTNNAALTELYCGSNRLTELDVTSNTALTHFSCSYNQLTGLDVTKNANLVELYCNNNQLTELDVNGNKALLTLYSPQKCAFTSHINSSPL